MVRTPPYPGGQTPAPVPTGPAAYTPTVVNPAQSRSAATRIPLIVAVAVVALLTVLAIPVTQRCGAPDYSCASTVDTNGNLHYYYEVEPLGVYLAEIVTGANITLVYSSGEDLVKPRQPAAAFAGRFDARAGRRAVSAR